MENDGSDREAGTASSASCSTVAKTKPRPSSATLDIALLIPLRGSAGMIGPSAELCAQLAVEEINDAGGVVGREMCLHAIDASGPTARVAKDVAALVADGGVDAVVGWHLSPLRIALAPLIAHRVPYIYTALYEGGERTKGVFLTGEIPGMQLAPAIEWMGDSYGTSRWVIVGNDYVWPWKTAEQFRRFAEVRGNRVVDEMYVPLGASDFSSTLRRVERAQPDAVLVLLVGEDAAKFNRSFAVRNLEQVCQRLSPLMDENMVLASGARNTAGLHTASGFFESLATTSNLDFSNRYARRFGPHAPMLNSAGESCYEGVRLLEALAVAAKSINVGDMYDIADGTTYYGARGELRMHDAHVRQPIYMAKAKGLDMDVVAQI
jgi:ABC-type branched-subunit amino acid transport system substrate-binding protein